MTEIKRRLYEEFSLNKVLVIAPKKVAEDTWTREAAITPADTEAPAEAEPVIVKIPMLDMTELSATFNGWFTPEAFLGWISKLPIPEAEVEIRVSVTKRGEAV